MPVSALSGFNRNRAGLTRPAYREQPQIEEYEIEPPPTGPYQTNAQRRIRNQLERKVGNEELRSRLQRLKDSDRLRAARLSNEMRALSGVDPSGNYVGFSGLSKAEQEDKVRAQALEDESIARKALASDRDFGLKADKFAFEVDRASKADESARGVAKMLAEKEIAGQAPEPEETSVGQVQKRQEDARLRNRDSAIREIKSMAGGTTAPSEDHLLISLLERAEQGEFDETGTIPDRKLDVGLGRGVAGLGNLVSRIFGGQSYEDKLKENLAIFDRNKRSRREIAEAKAADRRAAIERKKRVNKITRDSVGSVIFNKER